MVVPGSARATQVRPGVSRTGWPAASTCWVGASSDGFDQRATIIWPPVSTQASPWPTDPEFRQQVFGLIDLAFAQRRNTSRNAFAEWAGTGNESARRLLAASIDPSRRGETLRVADFVRLLQRSGELDEPRARRQQAEEQPSARSEAPVTEGLTRVTAMRE